MGASGPCSFLGCIVQFRDSGRGDTCRQRGFDSAQATAAVAVGHYVAVLLDQGAGAAAADHHTQPQFSPCDFGRKWPQPSPRTDFGQYFEPD